MPRKPTVLFHVPKRQQRALAALADSLLESGKSADETIRVIVKVVDDVVDLASIGALVGGVVGNAPGMAAGSAIGAALDRIDDDLAIAIATGCVRRAERRRGAA